ncbi:germination protein YpeB [Thalassobacillus sp. CUG 92003]|uniref:germination protein YpeB n=1 Tax=Thalassobacillus sp. CUG 92003 TaxID=2736641 RepID=UPI0015E793B5|nr:germination protein YpeB [Thalassobacillus sp. CUG 92003]
MFRWITIVVLALALTGVGVWGYKENQDKNAVLIQAENNYQRSFHELTYLMDLLNDKIGTVLAINSKEQLSPELAEIWRITSEANADVGQLPLTLMPFNKTEEFLYDIGDFAYKTAVRDLDQEPLSDKEIKGLRELYKQSGEIKKELRKVQNTVLQDNLRWMDVELALATNENTEDNTIINGFKTVEKSVTGYSENESTNFPGGSHDLKKINHLDGEDIGKDEAIDIANKWFEKQSASDLVVTKSGKGADVPTITVSFENGDKSGYMDISKQGGHPLNVMINRPVKESKISLYEGGEKGKERLEKLDLPDMEMVQSSQYENTGVYTFVYSEDEVRMYPDAIQLKVALDDGQVLNMSALDYFASHHERDVPKPSISEEEARKQVNPGLDIQQHHLAVIENNAKEEVLCYEFLGTMDNETYKIFINAETGKEEDIEKLKKAEMIFGDTV